MVDKVNINLTKTCQWLEHGYPTHESQHPNIYACEKPVGHTDKHYLPWRSKEYPNTGPNPLVHDLSNVKLYLVGGAVREILRGKQDKVKDWDFAVEADSFDLMRVWILAHGFEIFTESEDYFTIRARAPKSGWVFAGINMSHLTVDFTLCRKDGTYYDGRHPESVEAGTLADDLSRRDLTMNSIAMTKDRGYIDPFNGRWDIENGIIRCTGSLDRMEEDGLRIIRALRFAVQTGFKFAPNLADYLNTVKAARALERIDVNRVRDELYKALKIDTGKTIRLLARFDLLSKVIFVDKGIWFEPTTKKVSSSR